MWLRFFSSSAQCCSAPASAWVLIPLELGELGLEEGKEKKAFRAPPSRLGNDVVEKKPQWEKKHISSWSVAGSSLSDTRACADTAKSWNSGREEDEHCLFRWDNSFKSLSQKTFALFLRTPVGKNGTEWYRSVRIFVFKGKLVLLTLPLDHSVWKWLEQINHTEFFSVFLRVG